MPGKQGNDRRLRSLMGELPDFRLHGFEGDPLWWDVWYAVL